MNRKPLYEHWGTLSISEEEAFIFVQGETFRYGFDKKSGLISHLEVLGGDFLQGTGSQIPDIYISDARDPRESSYSAKYEDEAECDVISANPHEIHIRTHGIYHNSSGEVFPVRYRVTYEIQSDGTIFVIVNNKAYEPCVIRWLCISRGILNPSLCKYFSHLADQSKVDTTEYYTFEALPEAAADVKTEVQTLFSGRFIPWFWIGNDRTGVEICMWDVMHHRYGATQIAGQLTDPLGEIGANVSVTTSAEGALWEIFSLRNLQTPVENGWEQINYFALSVTPPKRYNPEFADLRAYWTGPRRYNTSYKYTSDDEIRELCRMGCNLIIGGANWRSGEYIPDDESEVNRVISTCHKHGMQIIPCVLLMELSEDTPVFAEKGPEWRIEPVVEYEYETHLMCPGSEGWREHWEQQIDRIAENYDFDGVYLDFWYDKLACRNSRHGCQRRYMRPTFPWVRDMLRHALAKFRAKGLGSTIAANTDILPISMICSWIDVRSVGGSQDIRDSDRMIQKAFYNSHRLGCSGLICPAPDRKIDPQLISLSLLYMSPILMSRERSREEIDLVTTYWNVLRFFGIRQARWYPGFVDTPEVEVATASNPDLYVNVHKHRAILLTLVNLSPDDVRDEVSLENLTELGLQSDKRYLIYDPVSQRFLEDSPGPRRHESWSCDDLRAIPVNIPGHSPRLLYIRESAGDPTLLFALGSDEVLEERWDESDRVLRLQLAAPDGAVVSLAIHSPAGKPARFSWNSATQDPIASAGGEVAFTWDGEQKLAFLDIQTEGETTSVSMWL